MPANDQAATPVITPEFQKSVMTIIADGIAAAFTKGKKKPAVDEDEEDPAKKDFSNLTMAEKEKAKTKKADDVEKAAIPEAIQKQLDDLRKSAADANTRAEAAEAIAKAEQNKTLDREFLAKAEKLDHIPGKPADVAAFLKSLHDIDPAKAIEVETMLKAANEAAEQGALFKTAGMGGGSAVTGAEQEAETLAKAYLAKGDVQTLEQGIAKAYQDTKGLYARVKAERPS